MLATTINSAEPFPALLDACFRTNPDYTLVAHDQLSKELQDLCSNISSVHDHYGLLIPSAAFCAGVKAAGNDVARLFSCLKQPSTLPDFLFDEKNANDTPHPLSWRIARLLLDGVIEIKCGTSFVSGPEAATSLDDCKTFDPIDGMLSELSNDALLLAMQLPSQDVREVSSWLYHYNTLPLTPQWFSRLGRGETELNNSGETFGGCNIHELDYDYENSQSDAWHSWQHRCRLSEIDPTHLGYKLYVSMLPAHLSKSMGILVETLVALDVQAFKLGRGSLGLMRPDKLVIYTSTREQLEQLSSALKRVLINVEAQGVPFTAPLSYDGLLSWGMDPPPEVRLSGVRRDESWRTWLCSLLARSVVYARDSGLTTERCLAYVRIRAQLEGVDSRQWLPAKSVWQEYGAHDERT